MGVKQKLKNVLGFSKDQRFHFIVRCCPDTDCHKAPPSVGIAYANCVAFCFKLSVGGWNLECPLPKQHLLLRNS